MEGYHPNHVYNLTAKVLRERMAELRGSEHLLHIFQARLIDNLAVDFALEFEKNDPDFDAEQFFARYRGMQNAD